MAHKKPTMQEIVELVKGYDKRIGLRMLYSRYKISEGERYKYRVLWDEFYKILPDAFEKELSDASKNRETKENDGDSGTPAGEALQEEPEGAENVQETTA